MALLSRLACRLRVDSCWHAADQRCSWWRVAVSGAVCPQLKSEDGSGGTAGPASWSWRARMMNQRNGRAVHRQESARDAGWAGLSGQVHDPHRTRHGSPAARMVPSARLAAETPAAHGGQLHPRQPRRWAARGHAGPKAWCACWGAPERNGALRRRRRARAAGRRARACGAGRRWAWQTAVVEAGPSRRTRRECSARRARSSEAAAPPEPPSCPQRRGERCRRSAHHAACGDGCCAACSSCPGDARRSTAPACWLCGPCALRRRS